MVHFSFLDFSLSVKVLTLEEGWQCSQVNVAFPSYPCNKGRSVICTWKQQEGASRRLAELGGAASLPLALPSASCWIVAGAPTAISVHEAALMMERTPKIEKTTGSSLFSIIRSQSSHTSYGFLSSRCPSYERERNFIYSRHILKLLVCIFSYTPPNLILINPKL